MIIEPNVTVFPKSMPGRVVTYEYAATKADIHILLVDHNDFKKFHKPEGLIIDTKGTWI